MEDSEVNLNEYHFDNKQKCELTNLIVGIPKTCMGCGMIAKDIIIMKCCCMLCRKCLRKKLLEHNKTLITGTFDSKGIKEAMCVCTEHNYRVEPKILEAAFSPKELEEYTIGAMKRDMKEGYRIKNLWPDLCIRCKGLLQNVLRKQNTTRSCYRHKLCRGCIE